MTFEITVDDSSIRKMAKQFPSALEKAIQLTALELHRNIVIEAPKGTRGATDTDPGVSRTSRLAGSWHPEKISKLEWGLWSNVVYRMMVQTGTKPHDIRPKTKKVLRFKVKGEVVFARIVHHPGTKANPYITRAIEATKKRLPEFADKAVKEAERGTVRPA